MSVHPRPKQGNRPLPFPNFSNFKTNCETKKKKKKQMKNSQKHKLLRHMCFTC